MNSSKYKLSITCLGLNNSLERERTNRRFQWPIEFNPPQPL